MIYYLSVVDRIAVHTYVCTYVMQFILVRTTSHSAFVSSSKILEEGKVLWHSNDFRLPYSFIHIKKKKEKVLLANINPYLNIV